MIKHLFFSLLLILCLSKLSFPINKDSIATKIFISIYNDKYIEAHSEIVKNQADLGDFYADVLTIDLLWWEFIQSKKNTQQKNKFISFLNKFDTRYEDYSEFKLRQLIKNSYLIRYELKRFNLIAAIGTRSKLQKLLDEINSKQLSYHENRMKLLVIYTELFQYFDNMFVPLLSKTKREIRTNALNKIALLTGDEDIIVRTFSLYFLGKIYLNIEKDIGQGKFYFQTLANIYPQNQIFKEVLHSYN